MKISLLRRRILLLLTFLWMIGLIFIPVRKDILSGHYEGDTPTTSHLVKKNQVVSSSVAIGFNGHPGGIAALLFFMLMPFFIVWESFNLKRPFSFPARTFLQLEALLLFLGAPYCYYIATYQNGNFYEDVHKTELAIGGDILFVQNIVIAVYLFVVLGNPNGKWAQFFDERD
ncbi:MAG: hypothetical protein HY064_11270 [Bacteroidetes bacterium]|nr:hypothetical protein [Bacteroidota bacterium]